MDEQTSPLARGNHLPRPTRPPGLVPPPRVVFRTRRKDLSHQNRVKRLDGMRNLADWQEFSDRFIRSSGSLDAEISAYLIDRGFDADKSRLYSLPQEDVDDYLSDLQVRLLPYANGADGPILENRQLFRQAFHGLLPFAPLVAVVAGGKVVSSPASAKLSADEANWVLPTVHTSGERMYIDTVAAELVSPTQRVPCPDIWAALADAGTDALVVRCPGSAGLLDRLRVFVVRDPRSADPMVMAAVVAARTPASGPFDTLESGAISAWVDLETGTVSAAKHLVDGAPEDVDASMCPTDLPLIGRAVPHWWEVQHQIHQALLRLPMFSVLQVDFSVGGAEPMVVDATARVEAAEFQVHGPIMGSQVCRRLMREYGL